MWHLHKLPGPANAFLSRLALAITIMVPCLPLRASRPPSKSPPDSFLQPPLTILRMKLSDVLTNQRGRGQLLGYTQYFLQQPVRLLATVLNAGNSAAVRSRHARTA